MPTYSRSAHYQYDPHNYNTLNYGVEIDNNREDKILENYIKQTWALNNPDINGIAWGKETREILKSNKSVTLRCWLPLVSQSSRWAIKTIKRVTPIRIEVAVIDRNINNNHESSRLTIIQRYLQSWIAENCTNLQDKGIHHILETNCFYPPTENPGSMVYILNIDVDATVFLYII